MLTIRPPRPCQRIRRAARCPQSKGPTRSTSNTSRTVSRDRSTKGVAVPVPALLTRMSRPTSSSASSSMRPRIRQRSEVEAGKHRAAPVGPDLLGGVVRPSFVRVSGDAHVDARPGEPDGHGPADSRIRAGDRCGPRREACWTDHVRHLTVASTGQPGLPEPEPSTDPCSPPAWGDPGKPCRSRRQRLETVRQGDW